MNMQRERMAAKARSRKPRSPTPKERTLQEGAEMAFR